MRTPLEKQINLSKRFKNNILLKRGDLQPVFSFKIRGAYNKMKNLIDENLKNGVIACSAGNHAQGVALAATIFSLVNAPPPPFNICICSVISSAPST